MELDILYEDSHLIAVDKPGGLLTQPNGTNSDSLEMLCKAWLKNKYHKPGNVFLHAIHRIDKPVSGIVVFAKTSKALSRLQEAMRNKNCKKIYFALLEKAPPAQEGALEHYLIHDDHWARISHKNDPMAKFSRLHYRVKEKKEKILLEIELETGRYHQIRAQLAAIGCPIIGDIKYGGKRLAVGECIALRHVMMQLPHPISREMLTITVSHANLYQSF
jgi:23S rRNA pseudouridine1911/1915/1917 synthase